MIWPSETPRIDVQHDDFTMESFRSDVGDLFARKRYHCFNPYPTLGVLTDVIQPLGKNKDRNHTETCPAWSVVQSLKSRIKTEPCLKCANLCYLQYIDNTTTAVMNKIHLQLPEAINWKRRKSVCNIFSRSRQDVPHEIVDPASLVRSFQMVESNEAFLYINLGRIIKEVMLKVRFCGGIHWYRGERGRRDNINTNYLILDGRIGKGTYLYCPHERVQLIGGWETMQDVEIEVVICDNLSPISEWNEHAGARARGAGHFRDFSAR